MISCLLMAWAMACRTRLSWNRGSRRLNPR